VEAEPEKLAAAGVTLDHMMEVTSQALDAGLLKFAEGGFIGTGGFIDTPNQRLGVRHKLPIVTAEDLAEVALAERDGKTLKIGDVAKVAQEAPNLAGDAIINDGPGLMLVVEKLPWGNTVEVTKDVEQAMKDMAPGLPGITVDTTIFRPATFVELAIDHLTESLILGALLVLLVLGLFLYDWRSALISVITMPLSLVAAGLVLYARGATINTMVLAGLVIALGAIVDDAIVDVENIVRRLRQARLEGSTQSTAGIILDASIEVRGAIVYASFIEVIVLIPVFFLNSLTGSFFKPLASTYALAVMVSLAVALISTPALSLILYSRAKVERHESPLARHLRNGYTRIISPTVRRPLPAYVALGALAVAGIAVVPKLGQELFPEFKEQDFLMHWLSKPGTSLPEERRIVIAGSKELRQIPGVRNFGSHIGQALIMDEVYGVYFGENWISVDPKVDYDKTLAAIQKAVDGYPGLVRDVQTYLKERIREVLTGSPTAITVRIFGEDLAMLRAKADEVKTSFEKIPGIVDLKVESQKEIAQIDVKVDLAAAEHYGVKPGDVRRTAAALVTGTEVGDIFRGGKAYDVNVWSIPECRNSVNAIRDLEIDTPRDGQVRLASLASVNIVPTPNHIERWQMKRKIDVRANVRGRDLGSVVADVRRQLSQVEFPKGTHPELLGEYAEREKAQGKMRTLTILSAVGILFDSSFLIAAEASSSFLDCCSISILKRSINSAAARA
jgi:Cu/Ag efflux pump CusA